MTGCFAHVVGSDLDFLYLSPAATVPTVLGIPNQSIFIGVPLVAQGFAWSPPLTPLGAIASNGQMLTLGL